jgi:F0F1-type ATP synthase assembly protein I
MDHGSSGPPDSAGLRGRDLLGLGGFLVGAVVGGLVIGLFLDAAFDTSPLFVLLGIFLGIIGAGAGFWVKVRDALRQ